MTNDVKRSQWTGDNKARASTMLTSDGRLPSVDLSPHRLLDVKATSLPSANAVAGESREGLSKPQSH